MPTTTGENVVQVNDEFRRNFRRAKWMMFCGYITIASTIYDVLRQSSFNECLGSPRQKIDFFLSIVGLTVLGASTLSMYFQLSKVTKN